MFCLVKRRNCFSFLFLSLNVDRARIQWLLFVFLFCSFFLSEAKEKFRKRKKTKYTHFMKHGIEMDMNELTDSQTQIYVIFQSETSLPTHYRTNHEQYAHSISRKHETFSTQRPNVVVFFLLWFRKLCVFHRRVVCVCVMLPFTNFSTKCTFNYIG